MQRQGPAREAGGLCRWFTIPFPEVPQASPSRIFKVGGPKSHPTTLSAPVPDATNAVPTSRMPCRAPPFTLTRASCQASPEEDRPAAGP